MGDFQGHPFRGNQWTGGFPSPPGGFYNPVLDKAPTADPGFAYHATNEENARDIASSGKLDVHRASYGTEDQDAWPDGSTQRRSYFIADPAHAGKFAPEHGQPVLLRAPSSGLRRESTGDLYSTKPTPASAVEILGADGKWYKLIQDDYEKNPAKQVG